MNEVQETEMQMTQKELDRKLRQFDADTQAMYGMLQKIEVRHGNRLDGLADAVGRLEGDVAILKSDVRTLKSDVSRILEILESRN